MKFLIIAFFIIIIAVYYLIQIFLRKTRTINLEKENIQEKINLIVDNIKNRSSVIESLNYKIHRYESLKGLTEKLSSNLTLDETVNLLVSEAQRLLFKKNNVCILYLLDAETKVLGIVAVIKDDVNQAIKSKVGEIFDSWVLVKMQPLIIEDTEKDFRFDLEQISSKDARTFRSLIAAPLTSGKRVLGVLRIDNPKEGVFNSEDLRFLSTISDLGAMAIENAFLYQRTKELAIRDGLTNLYLRRYFFQQLDHEIIRSMRKNSQLSLIILDIDKFKTYNDKFGHIAGDIVLKTIGGILTSYFGAAGNVICRYGGEEFAVLLPDISKVQAIQMAEDLRKKIKAAEIILRKKETHITVSAGLATFPLDARIKEELILKADSQLLKAKELGRDKVCYS